MGLRLLVDTSIWIDHIRSPDMALGQALNDDRVLMHPFVLGELIMGPLPSGLVADLDDLPDAELAALDEVREVIRRHRLAGTGLGYVDAHLVASTLITMDCKLLTRDKRMLAVAERLGIAA